MVDAPPDIRSASAGTRAEPAAAGQPDPDVRPSEEPAESPQLSPLAEPAATVAYVQLYTYLPADLEERLHHAAWAAGGGAFKSAIVRAALTDFERTWSAAETDPERLARLTSEIRHSDVDFETGGHTPRIYRVEREVKERLHQLAGRYRVPMAACVRFAIRARLDAAERAAGDGGEA